MIDAVRILLRGAEAAGRFDTIALRAILCPKA
jgi:hypothetical protein